jgi:transcriptional regulator with XRE-family HTH domain
MSRRHVVTEEDMRQRMRRSIRARRMALSLTVKQAAQRVGMHPRQWQKIEYGERNVTIATIEKVARALEIDVYELLRGPPPKGSRPVKPRG